MSIERVRIALAALSLAAIGLMGCATKNYVKTQTAPLVQHSDQLDQQAADNKRQIGDVDTRATAGINHAQSSADSANQNAQNATQAAGTAQTAANDAVNRADTLGGAVKDLDNYKQQTDVTVNFGFDKAVLTKDEKAKLDEFGGQLGSQQNFILEVTGGTDSTGPAQYNYDLSQRRADAVVQYLAAKYNVAPHRFYLIGIGKDNEVADNKTAAGRKENRRVQVQLLVNQGIQAASGSGQTAANSGQSNPPAQQ
jgi:outer membrane protein OmpA-like peptidoglycan-associated protein